MKLPIHCLVAFEKNRWILCEKKNKQFWTIEVEIQQVTVIGKLKSPRTIHDQCSTSDHSSDLKCSMNGANLECALQPCGGQKYKCDCNVYR